MSKNYVDAGWKIEFTAGADVTEGDPMVLGSAGARIPAVASHNVKNTKTGIALAGGIFKLPVKGEDGTGNAAVSKFDKIYLDSGVLNVDATNGDLFGIALEAVASGETTNIKVRLVEPY